MRLILCAGLGSLLAFGCSQKARYQWELDSLDVPGAQMTVIEPDDDVFVGVSGVASADVPVSSSHRFAIGSVTKMFTAATVFSLVDDGALSLEDAAVAFVPGLDERVTVRDLLRHTSGVGEYFLHEDVDELREQDRVWAPEELLALGMAVGDEGPTEVSQYANTNFIALGLLIEVVDGRPYEEALSARVLEPLGLDDTRYRLEQ